MTSASLARVTIEGKGSEDSYGVYAEGKESLTMTLTDVRISRVGTGVYAEKGTLMMKDGTTIEFTGNYGVSVGNNVTKAELTRVTIEGQSKGYGVYAVGSETLEMILDGVTISGVQMGVKVERGVLKMTGKSTIDFMGDGWGVMVGDKVESASLKNVTIEGRDSGYGVYAVGKEEMTMTLDDVRISKVEVGVYAKKGMLKMTEGSVTDFADYGVKLGSAVTSASLARVTIEGDEGDGSGYGVYAVGGTNLEMTLDGVTISGVKKGVRMEGKSLTISGHSTISFMGDYGIGVGSSVKNVSLKDVTITGQNKGKGTRVY
ncbi:hypothetical protein m07a_11100 [Bartonella schoenbuchensis m07a]|uniref:Right handed beta helix domain-containing protein n=1 Tax=Bartonella schoenbuchensis m07a TaxID=1094496 RepID=N6ULL3_9HYPH|nr:hypothetical protein m07a_11100 [Bartonella schoenbuchensis m07a]